MIDDALAPDGDDLQRLDALQRDLRAAAERAIAAGSKPVDVITCMGLVLGGLAVHMSEPPSNQLLGAMIEQVAASGRRLEQARIQAEPTRTYGGEAREPRR